VMPIRDPRRLPPTPRGRGRQPDGAGFGALRYEFFIEGGFPDLGITTGFWTAPIMTSTTHPENAARPMLCGYLDSGRYDADKADALRAAAH